VLEGWNEGKARLPILNEESFKIVMFHPYSLESERSGSWCKIPHIQQID